MGGLQHGGQKRGCLEERGTKHSHAQPLGHRPLGWGSSTGEVSWELRLVPLRWPRDHPGERVMV